MWWSADPRIGLASKVFGMVLSGFLVCLLYVGAESACSGLDLIDLPLGFFREGITLGDEWTAFVGCVLDGSIWKGDLSTGEGVVVVSGEGGFAAGLEHDRRSGYLYVAGGPSGSGRVYDEDFGLVVEYAFAGVDESSFVNDVYVTKTAAYFTDSFRNKLYKVPLEADDGKLVNLAHVDANTITLSEDFVVVEGAFNANGIVAIADGSMLIVANSNSGQLFTVDPETGMATVIDLGGVAVYGDGVILRRNTLWAVENGGNGVPQQIVEVSLSADLTCGAIVPRALTNTMFDSPTTAVRKGNSFYVVNAKFRVAEEDISTTAYEIVRVDRDSGEYTCTSA